MLHIRPLTLLDYPRYVELFQELGVDDPVPTLSQVRSELLPHLLVAEQDGGVVGFARVQCFVDTGYVRQIAVDSAVRRQGVGQALMAALRERFLQRGARRWCLNVKPNNWPARRLYEKVGMQGRYTSVALRFDWALVARLPARAASVEPLPLARDRALESLFGLPPGQLADFRALPGRIVLGVSAGQDAHGLACFDPAFPGAFPFRVSNPELAAPLLTGCQAHARHPYMQLVVEDDEALEKLLLTAGASERLRMIHYEGGL